MLTIFSGGFQVGVRFYEALIFFVSVMIKVSFIFCFQQPFI